MVAEDKSSRMVMWGIFAAALIAMAILTVAVIIGSGYD